MPRFHFSSGSRGRRCGGGGGRRHGGGGGGSRHHRFSNRTSFFDSVGDGGERECGVFGRNRRRRAIRSGRVDQGESGSTERRSLCGGGRRGCLVTRFFNYSIGGSRRRRHCGRGRGRGRGGHGRHRPVICQPGTGPRPQSDDDSSDEDDQTAPEPDPVKTLIVQNVDIKRDQNCRAHFTSEYELKNSLLVVRRGQCFDLAFHFNRPYNPKEDDLKLIFEIGNNPSPTKGTSVEVLLSAEDAQNKWGAKILSNEDNVLTVTIFTPSTMCIGKWEFGAEVVVVDGDAANVYAYEHPDPIYVLFNPWCKNDSAYLENDEHRQEYVLNDKGKIYSGSSKSISFKPWFFGQFEENILETAMFLLDQGDLKMQSRGNPITVVRKLTAMVNSSDDSGVLTGNWSGNYDGGRSPLSWTGSAAILQRYWQTKRPVKFGQCWVFSGVTTTLMRALGIAARSITNFASAHDTDGSITIDYHFNQEGEPDSHLDSDSIWNFHVWNEVWMARPDLPTGFGGWQACDATPQEQSDGIYVCGPVSVQAIKQGEVNLPYDGPFVFAEVNADIVYWVPDFTGDLKAVQKRTASVGQFISTKACGTNDRDDVTNHYKHPEGSAEERASVLRANQTGSTNDDAYEINQATDVSFSVEQDSENTWVGHDFSVSLRIKNKSSEDRTVDGRVCVKSMYYTGVTAEKIKTEPLDKNPIKLKAGKEIVKKLTVKPAEYIEYLKDGCMLDVTHMATVAETKQIYTSKEDYRLKKPALTVKGPKEMVVGKQFVVDVSFLNPLDKMLTRCEVEVDGLSRDLTFKQGNVPAKGTFSARIPVQASRIGHKELVLIFTSKELEDINCSHPIFIKSA